VLTVLEDGSRLRVVGLGSDPSWSPDGSRLAAIRGHQLWTMDADGDGGALVFEAGPTDRVGSPTWTPDGTAILFDLNDDVWSVGSDGGDPHVVLDDAAAPEFSPDGSVLLTIDRTPPPVCDDCECPPSVTPAIRLSDPDGSDPVTRWIADAHEGISAASFSPDGSRVAVEYPVLFGTDGCEDFIGPSVAVVGIDATGFLPFGPATFPFPELTDPDWSRV
jgi:dipeptidyl aminopeptidase/acylaminoacyl peptidase